jgi:hypothetical protein
MRGVYEGSAREECMRGVHERVEVSMKGVYQGSLCEECMREGV